MTTKQNRDEIVRRGIVDQNVPSQYPSDRNFRVEGPKGPVLVHNCEDRESDIPLLGPAEPCCEK